MEFGIVWFRGCWQNSRTVAVLLLGALFMLASGSCGDEEIAMVDRAGSGAAYPTEGFAAVDSQPGQGFFAEGLEADYLKEGGPTLSVGSADRMIREPDVAAGDRLIVRSAFFTILATDVEETLQRIASLASSTGGFVVSSRLFGDLHNRSGTVVIRVPFSDTENALDAIRQMANEVRDEQVQSQDVTEEFSDLQAQLANLEASEMQMRILMDEATKVSEILDILRELKLVRGEIEKIAGRIQFLERTSSTSIISVTVVPAVILLDDLAPSNASQGTEGVTITAFGSGFSEGTMFYLTRIDQGKIRPKHSPRIVSPWAMEGVFDIPNDAAEGPWDVVAESLDAKSKPLANWFTITEDEGWTVWGVVKDAVLGLRSLFTGLLWIVVFTPVWLTILVFVWIVGIRGLRGRRRKSPVDRRET